MGLLLPEEIKALRQRLNLTQIEMSDLLQIGEKTYTRWESGRSRPSQVLNLLLRALRDGRLDVAYLRSHRKVSFNWHLALGAVLCRRRWSLPVTELDTLIWNLLHLKCPPFASPKPRWSHTKLVWSLLRMKNSPLQLKRYFVTELGLTASKEFDPKKEIKLGIESMVVTPALLPDASIARQWQVTLRIQLQPDPNANAPYFFTLEIVGFFRVQDAYPKRNVEWIVQTNATSVLYSAAREILRSAMAQGPYPAVPAADGVVLRTKSQQAGHSSDRSQSHSHEIRTRQNPSSSLRIPTNERGRK